MKATLSFLSWNKKVLEITNPYGDENWHEHSAIYAQLLSYWSEGKTPQEAANLVRGL